MSQRRSDAASFARDEFTVTDELGFEEFRVALRDVIQGAETPFVIGIFGDWGSGKTSLMQMVRADLDVMAFIELRARESRWTAGPSTEDLERAIWRRLRHAAWSQTAGQEWPAVSEPSDAELGMVADLLPRLRTDREGKIWFDLPPEGVSGEAPDPAYGEVCKQLEVKTFGSYVSLWFNAWKFARQEDAMWRAFLHAVLTRLETLYGFERAAGRQEAPGAEQVREQPDKILALLRRMKAALYGPVPATADASEWGKSARTLLGMGLPLIAGAIGANPHWAAVLGSQVKFDQSHADAIVDALASARADAEDHLRHVEAFERNFRFLVQTILHPFKLVVFVDDLDRCLPEVAIQVLEGIKLFLDVEGCIFVLGASQEVVELAIRRRYKDLYGEQAASSTPSGDAGSLTGARYLDKIIQLPFHLPPLTRPRLESFLAKRYDLPEDVRALLLACLSPNPRTLKRAVNLFRFMHRLAAERAEAIERQPNFQVSDALLAKMIVLQMAFQDLYRDVRTHGADRLVQWQAMLTSSVPEGERKGSARDISGFEGSSLPPQLAEPLRLNPQLRYLFDVRPRFDPATVEFYVHLSQAAVAEKAQEAVGPQEAQILAQLLSDDPVQVYAVALMADAVAEMKERLIQQLRTILAARDGADPKRRRAGIALGHLERGIMVPVPAGSFKFGGHKREVNLEAFEIGKYPVTNLEYREFLESFPDVDAARQHIPEGWQGGKFPPGKETHPAVGVNYMDAVAFCRWRSKIENRDICLPTEAQWEKAARGTDGREYPWMGEFDVAKANTAEGGLDGTSPVGAYPDGASPYGAMDMAGNVWEWTCTEAGEELADPAGDNGWDHDPRASPRVIKGGSWSFPQASARCGNRRGGRPGSRGDGLGFRCCSGSPEAVES